MLSLKYSLVLVFIIFGNTFSFHSNYEKSKPIVQKINENKNSTWQADTYGEIVINVDHFVKTHLGELPGKSINELIEESRRIQPVIPSNDDLPGNFTWADPNVTSCPIGHIRDQSNCGSCWAVSTASAFGDRLCIQSQGKIRVNISVNYITACDSSNHGCGGGNRVRSHRFLKKGVITGGDYESDEGCQMYTIRPCKSKNSTVSISCSYDDALTPKCRKKKCNNDWYKYKIEPRKFIYKAKSYKKTEPHEYYIRREIYENGPVTANFIVTSDFKYYKKGIFVPNKWAQRRGMHAVKIVGWGVENDIKYWHAVNSWTKEWGENGFFRIRRGDNTALIEGMVYSAMPDI